jgi:hypothetical protein
MKKRTQKSKNELSGFAKKGFLLYLVLILSLIAVTSCSGGGGNASRVKIYLKTKEIFPVRDFKEIYVAHFFTNTAEDFDLDMEMRRYLRKQARQKTKYIIIEDAPPPLPPLTPDEAFENVGFWEKMGEGHPATLIVTGTVNYELNDRTAFAMRKVTTADGREVYRNIPEDYTDFSIELRLIFIDGRTGEKLFDEVMENKETAFQGKVDPLDGFIAGMKRLAPSITKLLKPHTRTATRTILSN